MRRSWQYRYGILGLLLSASLLTYLDRVCISVAGPRIQDELHLSPQDWGLVTGAFALAYALFEIPGGYLADRLGARAMLTRIVLWWSAFTALTGTVTTLWRLLLVRFCFGMGEAGAYPTITTSIFRWFPNAERGRALGLVFFAAQLGGGLAPLILVPIQMRFGWRAAFLLFGLAGVLWTLLWWFCYRNNPAEMKRISQSEITKIGPPPAVGSHRLPLRALLANRSVWLISASAWTFQYAYYFILFWLPTYMVRARGFTEEETKLAALPFLVGACGNAIGGISRDIAVRRFGATWGPRIICCAGLGGASLCALAAFLTSNRYLALGWLGLCYGATTFQQPTNWATCVEIGRRYAGSVAGCMNTAGALGGLSSAMIFGYLVTQTGSYDSVLVSIVIVLGVGALLWARVDATEVLRGELPRAESPAQLAGTA